MLKWNYNQRHLNQMLDPSKGPAMINVNPHRFSRLSMHVKKLLGFLDIRRTRDNGPEITWPPRQPNHENNFVGSQFKSYITIYGPTESRWQSSDVPCQSNFHLSVLQIYFPISNYRQWNASYSVTWGVVGGAWTAWHQGEEKGTVIIVQYVFDRQ